MNTLELHALILKRLENCTGRDMRRIDAVLVDIEWDHFCRMWWRLAEWRT